MMVETRWDRPTWCISVQGRSRGLAQRETFAICRQFSKAFVKKKTKKKRVMRKLLKLLGKAPAVHRSVGKRPFLCLATETWGSVSKSAGLTSSVLWWQTVSFGLCLCWARFLSCLGGGREEGLEKGKKTTPSSKVSFLPLNHWLSCRYSSWGSPW